MSRTLAQSAAADVLVFMTDSADHVAGKSGLTLTITASKAAAAFASISPTVTDRGDGWYKLALTSSHTDTLGDLGLHITASGADPTDLLYHVSDGVTLAPGGLDGVDDSDVTGVPANFRERLNWLFQRFAFEVVKAFSAGSGTLEVKDSGGSTATTQAIADDGSGNQSVGAVS